MADLLRTKYGVPSIPLSTRVPQAQVDKTAMVLGQLGRFGAQAAQVYEGEHEKSMQRQAMNDLVNGSVNADLKMHEAAYAEVVAGHTARKKYNELQEKIKNGEFNGTSPEDFQGMLQNQHLEYKEELKKSNFTKIEAAAWDEFWLKNESTLTAGQSGMYRKALKTSQTGAMYNHMQELVKIPGVTADQIIDSLASDAYSMLDPDDIAAAALVAGSETGNKSLLERLNDELNFDVNPRLSKAYHASIAEIEKQDRSKNKQARANMYNEIKRLKAAGTLTLDFYNETIKDNPAFQDENGNDLMSEKAFVDLLWQSNVQLDKAKAQAMLVDSVQRGTLTGMEKPTDVNEAYATLINNAKAQQIPAADLAVSMGVIAKESPFPVPHYKGLAKQWSATGALEKDGSPNKQWENDFYTLQAFKDSAGDTAFYRHMDETTAIMYKTAERAFQVSDNASNNVERIQSAAKQVDLVSQNISAGTVRHVPTTDPKLVEAVDGAVDNMYGLFEYFPFFGKDRGDEEFDEGVKMKIKQHAAYLLNYGLSTKDDLEDNLEPYIRQNYQVVGGNLQDTLGKNLNVYFGADPDTALDAYRTDKGITTDGRVIVDMQNEAVRIRKPGEADKITPLSVIRRHSLQKSLEYKLNGEAVTQDSISGMYDRFEELRQMDLTFSGAGFDRDNTLEAIRTRSGSNLRALRNERTNLRSIMNRQDELNESFYMSYIQKDPDFDYDENKVTPEAWGKMSRKEKTLTRMNSIDEWLKGNDTVQKFFDNRATGVLTPEPTTELPEILSTKEHFQTYAVEAARQEEVDPRLVQAMIETESSWKFDATSPKGAQGLMQLMPGTAKEQGVTDPNDPRQNITGGTRYIKRMLNMFDGDLDKALAAYNWGPGNVKRKGLKRMPKETRHYLKRVKERMNKY